MSPKPSKGCSLICGGIALGLAAVLPEVQRSPRRNWMWDARFIGVRR
jgi:hypothetical protein